MDMDSAHLDPSLLTLAFRLIKAAETAPPSVLAGLLAEGAPAWFQDDDLGWSCLHYAAERKEPECLKVLLQGGAIWNAVDKWGRTAGEVCLSLGDEEGWSIIRNEGIRSGKSDLVEPGNLAYTLIATEMLHHALAGTSSPDTTNNIVLRAEDKTSAGDNLVFLKSKLTWDVGKDGKERVLDADGNG